MQHRLGPAGRDLEHDALAVCAATTRRAVNISQPVSDNASTRIIAVGAVHLGAKSVKDRLSTGGRDFEYGSRSVGRAAVNAVQRRAVEIPIFIDNETPEGLGAIETTWGVCLAEGIQHGFHTIRRHFEYGAAVSIITIAAAAGAASFCRAVQGSLL